MTRADTVNSNTTSAVFLDRAPFHGEIARELDHGCFGGVVHGGDEAPICLKPRDACYHADTAALFVFHHLLRGGFGGHENACVVDGEHMGDFIGLVLDGGGNVLDTCRSNYSIEASVLICDSGDELVKAFGVLYVLFAVV